MIVRIGIGCAATLLLACGGGQRGAERADMAEARLAFSRLQKGPAVKYFPDQYRLAEAAMQDAEKAYAEDRDAEKTHQLAVLATRRSLQLDQQAHATEAEFLRRNLRVKELSEQKQTTLARMQQAAADADMAARSKRDAALYAKLQTVVYKNGFLTKEDRGMVITLPNQSVFRKDESLLLPEGESLLNQIASVLKNAPNALMVEGHTSATGNKSADKELTLARAQAVRNYLVAHGLRGENAKSVGVGSERPLDASMTVEGIAKNRRTEIVISYLK